MGAVSVRRSFFLLCLTLFPAMPLRAVDPDRRISQYAHTAWRLRDGAFRGAPNAVAQSTDGYLWLGTDNGLLRFDGVRFVPWTPPGGPEADSRIFSVLATRDGSLWAGTARGLSRVKDGDVMNLDVGGRVHAMAADPDGSAVWIVRTRYRDERGPICRVSGRTLQCHGKNDGISDLSSALLARDTTGSFWFGSSALTRWRPGGGATEFFREELARKSAIFGLGAVAAGADGSVWVSLEQQQPGAPVTLRRWAGGTWTSHEIPQTAGTGGIVHSLFVDRHHAVWIGTSTSGIYRLRPGKGNAEIDHFGMADGLSSDAAGRFHEDHEGNLWVLTSQGIDVFRDSKVVSYSAREGLTTDSVSSLVAGPDGSVWLGNVGALDVVRDGKVSAVGRSDGGPMGLVIVITEDVDHDVWARAGSSFYRIRDLAVQEILRIPDAIPGAYTLAPDPGGGIWIGHQHGALARYRGGQIEHFPAPGGTPWGSVAGLVVEPDGSAVWAAIRQGLVHLSSGERKLLGTRNGLPCEGFYGLQMGADRSLWLYSQCGVLSIARGELEKWRLRPGAIVRVRILDALDGAQPALATFQPSATRTPDGRLWFTNDHIVQMVDPSRLDRKLPPPPVHIEQVVADRRAYAPRQQLVLPALTRDLEIAYTALSFATPQKVRFRYKLENRDAEWQDPGTRRQAFYSDLAPGSYRFRVIACNSDGVWNETGATLRFRIAPAWYQTKTFLVFAVLGALLLAWAVYRLRVRQIARRLSVRFDAQLAERTRIAREFHDTLLQTIQGSKMVADAMARSGDPDSMQRDAERLSASLGRAVEEGREALHSLRGSSTQESDLATALRSAAAGMPGTPSLDFSISVLGSPRELHPVVRDEIYRIGQEAIRNAYVHSAARRLEVELRYEKDITVKISDDGVGIAPDVAEHGRDGRFGLQGMHERAARIGATLSIVRPPAGGTEITLVVPGKSALR